MENSYQTKVNMIIAIDGPAGSGKSTVAKLLASKLNIEYIDSGAIYRTITLFGMRSFNKQCSGHEEEIAELLYENPSIVSITYINHSQVMWLEGNDILNKLRDPELTAQVKYIADNPACREYVNKKIREIAEQYSVVIDGRDIGTIVFPDTPYKFFLDANPVIRAKRRALDLKLPQQGEEFEKLLESINLRDKTDRERKIAPLKKADNAVYLDTTEMSVDEVLANVLMHYERIKKHSGS